MNILLIVADISNCLLNFTEDDYKKLGKILYKLEAFYNSQIFFSICDNTDNKDVLMFFIRKIKKYNENIYFSYQFLGNTYYRDRKDGAHLYTKELKKEEKIVKYANQLNKDCENLKLIYLSNIVDNDIISNLDCDYIIIKNNFIDDLNKLTKKLELTF